MKGIRNLFKLKKEQNGTAIKDTRNIFRLKKEVKGIKDIVLRNVKNFFEYEKEEETYYIPVKVNNFWRSNSHKNRILSVEEYPDGIRLYLRDIINDLKQSDTWKIQLTITINFISSKDDNDEERVMHSKSDNIEIMISDEANEITENSLILLKTDIKIIYNK